MSLIIHEITDRQRIREIRQGRGDQTFTLIAAGEGNNSERIASCGREHFGNRNNEKGGMTQCVCSTDVALPRSTDIFVVAIRNALLVIPFRATSGVMTCAIPVVILFTFQTFA
jgi:hypothetical protein